MKIISILDALYIYIPLIWHILTIAVYKFKINYSHYQTKGSVKMKINV